MSDMTSAVAIELLDNLIGMIEDNQENDYDTAFHMAIDALKAQAEKRTEERTETHECDLIDRQDVIDAILAVTGNSSVRELYEHVQEHGLSDMWSGGVNAAIDIIIAVPSAQPEIVRCEDCRYWEQETFNDGYCTEMDLRMCDADFYCGYAERRTDERSDKQTGGD